MNIMYKCKICESSNTKKLLNWNKPYSIVKCFECDLLFSNPMPTDEHLKKYYQGFLYHKTDSKHFRTLINRKKKELARLLPTYYKDPKGKSFLDFGGGIGIGFQAAKEMGFDSYIYEVDDKAIDFATLHFDLKKSHTFRSIESIQNNKFDIIFSDNVIEHCTNPIEVISNLYSCVKKDGTLLFKTPNAGSNEEYFYPIIITNYFITALKNNSLMKCLNAFFCNRYWYCDPPRHLYSFSKKSFTKIIEILNTSKSSILYYRIPLLENTLIKRTFSKVSSIKGLLLRVIMLPFMLLEIIIKIVQIVLTYFNVISPGGIILKIKK